MFLYVANMGLLICWPGHYASTGMFQLTFCLVDEQAQ
jgi:hypothetical protein